MKAIIFAAGLGTRLRPLTDNTPKALLQVNGKSLLAYAIEKLASAGVTEIIVNVHHLGSQIIDYLDKNPYSNIRFSISDESDLLLDTGGGLKKAEWFFDDKKPFFAYNADIITDLSLPDMLRFHQKNDALATLAVSERSTARYLLFDESEHLRGWTNIKTGEVMPKNFHPKSFHKRAFSGIHIIDPEIFQLIEKEYVPFPIIPEYLRFCAQHTIVGYNHTGCSWNDFGKPETMKTVKL